MIINLIINVYRVSILQSVVNVDQSRKIILYKWIFPFRRTIFSLFFFLYSNQIQIPFIFFNWSFIDLIFHLFWFDKKVSSGVCWIGKIYIYIILNSLHSAIKSILSYGYNRHRHRPTNIRTYAAWRTTNHGNCAYMYIYI